MSIVQSFEIETAYFNGRVGPCAQASLKRIRTVNSSKYDLP